MLTWINSWFEKKLLYWTYIQHISLWHWMWSSVIYSDFTHSWNFPSLGQICRGWKFRLTPLPSLGAKALKVIQETLPYICPILTYNILLIPRYHETCISYVCSIVNPKICTLVIFEDIANGATHWVFVGFTILKR